MKNRKTKIIITSSFLLLALFFIYLVRANGAIVKTEYTIRAQNLPRSFEDFKIAHVSDLHNAEFGADNSKLLSMLSEEKPDIIVITGDLIDSVHTDIEVAAKFAENAALIAPCYYVTGNHEARMPAEFSELKNRLEEAGVKVLSDESQKIFCGEEHIRIIGLDDPDMSEKYYLGDSAVTDVKLRNMELKNEFSLILSHRPELFSVYVSNGINLALCGHAHGGQIRLPFIGGLVAPNQGFFPKYDAGLFEEENTKMIVSRGLGNSLFPLRVNNRPELVFISLRCK